jgi:hypothetical protein
MKFFIRYIDLRFIQLLLEGVSLNEKNLKNIPYFFINSYDDSSNILQEKKTSIMDVSFNSVSQ